jgi:hypothetical protein
VFLRFRIIRLEILYIEMAHTMVANKSMFVILAIVRGAAELVVGPAEADTGGLAEGLAVGDMDGEFEGTAEGEIDGLAEGDTTVEKE